MKNKLRYGIAVLTVVLLFLSGSGMTSAAKFGAIQLTSAPLFYRTQEKPGAAFNHYRVNPIVQTSENGVAVYKIEQIDESSKIVLRATVRARDWQPLLVRYYDGEGQLDGQIGYENNMAVIHIPSRKISQSLKLGQDYFDCNLLFFFLRGYPFGDKIRIVFHMVMDGQYGRPIGIYPMYVKEVGREEIKVPAGAFDSYKLEMGVGGAAGIFARKYKYYLWYTATEPRFLLKYMQADGNDLNELVAVED